MDTQKNHILHIDSKNRSSGTNENFVVHLNENELHEAKYVQLKDISFANTMYNITNSNNQLNWIDHDNLSYSLTVPVGFYTADELASYITTETSTNAIFSEGILQVVNNTKTRTFTIIFWGTRSCLLTSSTILNVMGFPNPSQTKIASHTGTQPYNMLVTKYVHILSSKLAECDAMVSSNGKKYPVIATVPVNSPFGYIVSRSEEKDSSDESYHNSNVNLSSIDIRLVDDNFQTINLNASGVVMTFTIARH